MPENKTDITEHKNPFLEPYGTPHDTVPFDRIRLEDFEEAFMEGIRRDNELIEKTINNPDKPTFDNTIINADEDREGYYDLLSRVSTVFFNLLSAETNDDMDALAQKIQPILTQHANDVRLNRRLFERIKAVHRRHRKLTDEEKRLLDDTYDGFTRSGALLDDEGKERLREAAALAAKEDGEEGWTFTLDYPSYNPFMTYSTERELRHRLYMAKNTECTHDNAENNIEICKRIVNLRREIAQLLGFRTYADYVLKHRMAGNKRSVYKLLNDLIDAYKPTAEREVRDLTMFAKKTEGIRFNPEPWDFSYYSHKLQLSKYKIDAEMLRPYFELSNVIKGVFGLATRLYGITFKENKDIPVYHPDVKAYEVFDNDGSYLAVLYADFFPRKGKQGGAWMTQYQGQWIDRKGVNVRPHVSIVMNLTKPTEEKPALLTLSEVETFLHEFGHALHGMFANTRFESLSGTNVWWDFVELPSQFMENYSVQQEFLNTFAFHYKTGEPMPENLIKGIVKSRNFMAAYSCLRQVSFGLLDMAYYTMRTPFEGDLVKFEKEAWKKAMVTPQLPDTCMTVQFSHIMAGGYAAGYYSYKWAEVLEADAFSVFKREGIFNTDTARRFREEILSKGGTEHPMTLYKRFRNGESTIAALLRRNGIRRNKDEKR